MIRGTATGKISIIIAGSIEAGDISIAAIGGTTSPTTIAAIGRLAIY
jgi:hypothetical protein